MQNSNCCNSSCSIEAVVSVDERGQLVLPKDLREKYGVKAGDKFVVITLNSKESLCCIAFVKADSLNAAVFEQIAPVFSNIGK
ncbi:MAG: HgcAB-associated protein [Spirochaetota bacterium]